MSYDRARTSLAVINLFFHSHPAGWYLFGFEMVRLNVDVPNKLSLDKTANVKIVVVPALDADKFIRNVVPCSDNVNAVLEHLLFFRPTNMPGLTDRVLRVE